MTTRDMVLIPLAFLLVGAVIFAFIRFAYVLVTADEMIDVVRAGFALVVIAIGAEVKRNG